MAKNVGTAMGFTPVAKGKNIFATKDWKEYDYHKDIENDSALQSVKPVGREITANHVSEKMVNHH